ncbi:MAG: Protoheme IX farnesyltransferase, mitochondrial [Claussenomyces sp. TS43310]|nr:MAG: Protoheme IX farnesyltransferase, mitochondrial [Claussenomyces sp. TS43310]
MITRIPPIGAARYNLFEGLCSRCLHALSKPVSQPRRPFTTSPSGRNQILGGISPQRLRTGYFLYNGSLEPLQEASKRGGLKSASIDTSSRSFEPAPVARPSILKDLPHRRRQKVRQDAAPPPNTPAEPAMPPDMPSKLTTQASNLPANSFRRRFTTYLALSKPRLSFLIVLTTTSAYSLYPVPAVLSPSITDTPSLSALTLLFLTVGTFLTSASASSLNMLYEPKWDALMSRTKNRPLVRGLISSRGAAIFALVTGAAGTLALYYGVNPTVAFLGAFNIFLYAGVYTPMKRVSAINTWVGALVGGIPPLMGWAAAAGHTATGDGDWRELLLGEQNLGGWLLAALLFAWQFPHFMALSWPIRDEYKQAGYKMLAWTNPARNGRVALRYSLVFFPICVGLCYAGITEWTFAVASAPVNAWILRESWRFWRLDGAKGSARGLFWASVWHLPVVMVLAMVEKKGMWQRAWRAVVGEPELDDDDEWIEDDEDEQTASPVALSDRSRAVPVSSR